MANIYQAQTLIDTTKKAVLLFTAQFDGSGQETANTKIQGRTLNGALSIDTNNAVTVAMGGNARSNYNYSISRIIYDVNINNGYVAIKWDGTTPTTIINASGKLDWNMQAQMGDIPNNATGPNGNVTFTTVGAGANSSYSIMVELHKGPNQANNACDFNMGQIQSPSDMNFGKYGPKP